MSVSLFNWFNGRLEKLPPWVVIIGASVAAGFLMQEEGGAFFVGIAMSVLIVFLAFCSPWIGLLALFPMAFAIRPTPPTIGLQEAIFTVLLAVVFVGSVLKRVNNKELILLIRQFKYFVLVVCGFLAINLFVAILNSVSFSDWGRGVIPFVFIFTCIPIAILLGDDQERRFWFGCSVASLATLMVGYVVVYYFGNSLWQPYWHLTVDGEVVRVSKQVAIAHSDEAFGPLLDRITMKVQRSTDVLLPVGMVAGFVAAVLSKGAKGTIFALFLSMLSMAAILITFTRSMLASAVLVIGFFALFVIICRKERLLKLLFLLVSLTLAGFIFIYWTGMDRVWIGRMGWLIDSLESLLRIEFSSSSSEPTFKIPEKIDENITTRMEEYRIAWKMFLDHSFFGNGLGVKHQMRWETTEGEYLYQLVAYVHNWPLYMLMIGGVVGLYAYFSALFIPVLSGVSYLKTESYERTLIRTILITMAVYAMFFAVFRLVTFNLILAAAWGYMYSYWGETKLRSVNE